MSNDGKDLPAHPRFVTKRNLSRALFATPFILAVPVAFWVFQMAGGWFVSTDLDPEHRRGTLLLMYIPLMLSIAVLSAFFASLVRWTERSSIANGVLAITFGVLMIPALWFLAQCVESYLRFG